ncbi:MAG: cold shock domain-containing protein [Methyloceanibacter sp.]|uniref:cold shock domain-containing protein n=1 Tax=Methyloceanibacter sp. TaxID=1965321 RepID=UPI003D9AE570
MHTGRIVRWSPAGHYGFIRHTDTDRRDVFVHGSAMESFIELEADTGTMNGMAVSFTVGTRSDGKFYAQDVERMEE